MREAQVAVDVKGHESKSGTRSRQRSVSVDPPSLSEMFEALSDVRRELDRLAARVDVGNDRVLEVLARLDEGETAPTSPEKRAYRQALQRVRALVRHHLPSDAVVAVVSKGDEWLLTHEDGTWWHFPRDKQGQYAGCYPSGSLAAIAHLEALRAMGATHLLLPDIYDWWLTSYPGFAAHIHRRYEVVARQSGAGTLYSLASRPLDASRPEPLPDVIARLSDGLGRPPQVLDIVGAPRATELFPGALLFAPVTAPDGARASLPYIDASIDIVAVALASPSLLAEGRRVAALAVAHCGDEPVIEWVREPPATPLPSASVVIPAFNQWPFTRSCLRAVRETVPSHCDLEIIVVDDASTDDTARELASLAAVEPRLRVLRHDTNRGFVDSCNAGAAAATGEILVFLNNDTVPLPGWLEPLLRTCTIGSGAGAVGGRLLFPDGRLQEAGGIIFSDGSPLHFGRDEVDPTGPLFSYRREVDYVSGALLATPRALFASLGGFDAEFAPGYYEDTDYCFRLRARGHVVYYKPESTVVHFEGATAGTDPARGMKRHLEVNRLRFRARHAATLLEHGQRPDRFDADTWIALAHRRPGRDRA